MGVLRWLVFGRSDEEKSEEISEEDLGCTAHHWERTGFNTRDISLEYLDWREPPEYYVQIEAQYECTAGGCRATKTDWEHTVSLSEERGEEILDELKGEDDD